MIKRIITKKLIDLTRVFPAVFLVGPRQSGKTTLVRSVFPKKPYVLLENPDTLAFAQEDPRGFLKQYPDGAILDEVQRAPLLFSYLQGILDDTKQNGKFILTGSHNYLLMERISQSLAGRVAILTLLPLSLPELFSSGKKFASADDVIFNGCYPRLYDQNIEPPALYANYVRTYLERDVRMIKNVHDAGIFHRFLKMCAYRCGQIVNLSSLANDCGITHNTARNWLSILETSYIIYQLQPHHQNYKKRLIKAPKLYFCDPGLAAHLADISSPKQVASHPNKGGLFETLIVIELLKARYNSGEEANIYFWRDKLGREVDVIIEHPNALIPVEIKAGHTVNQEYFKNIIYWRNLCGAKCKDAFIVYGGDATQPREQAKVVSWKNLSALYDKVHLPDYNG